MPLVDTNVLLDLFTNDPIWADWSTRQLRILSAREALIINAVVYAELSVGYDRVEALDAVLATISVELVEIPRAALFLAGRAFQTYRARGGSRTGVLPDFFIGAHAAVARVALLTRDARRYRSYFPTITLITQGDA